MPPIVQSSENQRRDCAGRRCVRFLDIHPPRTSRAMKSASPPDSSDVKFLASVRNNAKEDSRSIRDLREVKIRSRENTPIILPR